MFLKTQKSAAVYVNKRIKDDSKKLLLCVGVANSVFKIQLSPRFLYYWPFLI